MIGESVLKLMKYRFKSMPDAFENSSNDIDEKLFEITLVFFPLPRASSKFVKVPNGATACPVLLGVFKHSVQVKYGHKLCVCVRAPVRKLVRKLVRVRARVRYVFRVLVPCVGPVCWSRVLDLCLFSVP